MEYKSKTGSRVRYDMTQQLEKLIDSQPYVCKKENIICKFFIWIFRIK